MKPSCSIATWTWLNSNLEEDCRESIGRQGSWLSVYVYAAASKTVPSLQALQAWTQPGAPRISSIAKQASHNHQHGCSGVLQLLSAAHVFMECTLGSMAEEYMDSRHRAGRNGCGAKPAVT